MIVTLLLAMGASFLLTLVLGRFVIAELRKLKAGQEIRKEGIQNSKEAGNDEGCTPRIDPVYMRWPDVNERKLLLTEANLSELDSPS